jgi:hypothetical protein
VSEPLPDLFHGGVPGLSPGDLLLPPEQTGAQRNGKHDLGEVFLTELLSYARSYAAVYPRLRPPAKFGAVYRAVPQGSYRRLHIVVAGVQAEVACASAVVEEVVFPVVQGKEHNCVALVHDDDRVLRPKLDKFASRNARRALDAANPAVATGYVRTTARLLGLTVAQASKLAELLADDMPVAQAMARARAS